jgi:polyisoprenoid-binding protein YceI
MKLINIAAVAALVGAAVTQTTAALAVDTWTIDPAHTAVSFTVQHMMINKVHGTFGKVAGTAKYDGKDLKNASVEATIEVNSINTSEEKRDGHLKSKDFFDAAQFPQIKFKSTSIKHTSAGFDMTGELTMHGVTKPVTLHADKLSEPVKAHGSEHVGTSATTKINRKDFGISFNGTLDNGGAMVGDEVQVTIDVDLAKDKEGAPAAK